MSTFEAEKAFLNRKLLGNPVEWDVIVPMSQIVSPALPEDKVKTIISQLRDALGKKAAIVFSKMVFSVNSKLKGGLRVVVSVELLREFFASEIDGWSGGGGRKLNPLKTNLSRGR